MPAISLNPGFIAILAGMLILAAPRALRAPIMAAAALAALWLLLEHDFGAAAAVAQMGLPVVLLDLDALNRIFGMALLIGLVSVALASNARRNRYEDAAILLTAGGAVSALFVGDLVSFVAAAALAGLGAAWIVFCAPTGNASRAGVRLLVWNGLEGLLMLVGVAFHLSAGAQASVFARLDIGTIGGAFIFAALLIRVGAPFAHVWVKDTIAHASPVGSVALTLFSTIVGVYALARLFPAEPLLIFVGAAMICVGALFAVATDDVSASAGYGFLAHTGVSVALVGVGSPLALAAAEGHTFTSVLTFSALQLALGSVRTRMGDARASSFAGLSRAMPITSFLLLIAGLGAAGAPGLALYISGAVGLEAVSQWDLRWLWALIGALSAALTIALVLRPMLAAHRPAARPAPIREAPFSQMLGTGLACFLVVLIGLAPNWLYGLMPSDLGFDPYAIDRLAPHIELLGAASVAYVLARAFGLAPKERALDVLDVDAFYRGPVTSAGRWAGVVLLRIYGSWQTALARLGDGVARALAAWARSCDTPNLGRGWNAAQLWIAAVTLIIILAGRQL